MHVQAPVGEPLAGVAAERAAAALTALEDRGLVATVDDGYVVTPHGRALAERLVALRRERLLTTYLSGCTEAERAAFAEVLERLARDLLAKPPQPEGGARRPRSGAQSPP